MRPYDCVVIVTNRFESDGVISGDIGWIIEEFSPDALEVEFHDPLTGQRWASVVAHPSELAPFDIDEE